MGRRGRPPKRPASATSSAEEHMKRVRDICLNSRFVNIGENGKKWQQHRRACEGSQPGFDFVGHLLSLHDVHCSRAPPENIDVKLEVDDEALHGDNGSLDEVQISLDGDLARQWRHLQKLAGYEAAEMEYLCWLMTVAEQMLGWKSTTEEKATGDRAEEDEDYTPEPPRQRRRRAEPTPAAAGPSFDTPVFDAPVVLPDYSLDAGDDSNSGSGGVPGGHADSDEDEDEDVKPEIVPAEGTLTKFTIKWADKPSTSTAPTSIETETTSHMEEEDIALGQPFPHINSSNYKATNDDSFFDTLLGLNDQYEDDAILPSDKSGPGKDPDFTPETTRKGTISPDPPSTQNITDKKKENDKPEENVSTADVLKDTGTQVDIKVTKKRGPYKKRKPKDVQEEKKPDPKPTEVTKGPKKRGPYKKRKKEGQEQRKRNRQPKDPTILDSYCHQCSKLFTERYALLMHCHKEHGGELPTKEYLCVHCGKRFGTNPILRHHIRHVHIEQPLVTCPVCSKQIKKVGFNGHMAKHKEEPVICDLCGQVMSKYSMDQHIKAVHFQLRPYPCEWPGCGKSFKDRKHLKQHSYLHTDEKPIQCQYCDYACRQTQSLKWHMNHTHPEIVVDTSHIVPANQKLERTVKVNVK